MLALLRTFVLAWTGCSSEPVACGGTLDQWCARLPERCSDLPEDVGSFAETDVWELRQCGDLLEFWDGWDKDSVYYRYYAVDTRELVGVGSYSGTYGIECPENFYGAPLPYPCPELPIASHYPGDP